MQPNPTMASAACGSKEPLVKRTFAPLVAFMTTWQHFGGPVGHGDGTSLRTWVLDLATLLVAMRATNKDTRGV